MYTVVGARVSMSRRKLPIAELSKDEEGSDAYESLQEENEWSVSYM